MTSEVDSRSLRAALESEIAVMERTRDALRIDSHLRTLCDLATERLSELLWCADPVPRGPPRPS